MKPTIPSRMRALVLSGQGFDHLSLATVPVPRPGPKQLLARVDAAGICTSLIKLIEQGPNHSYLYGWDTERNPIILGDEGAVTLVAIGNELSEHYHIGERFVVQPAVDHPPINHRDRYSNVDRVHKVAVGHTLPGHLAEYLLIPEEVIAAQCLIPIPDGLPAAHAAMSEPISCCVAGQEHHLHLVQTDLTQERYVLKGLKPGGVTVIVGAGAMGRMHADVALSYRPRALIITDFIEERLERCRTLFAVKAKELGTDLYLHHAAQDVMALIQQVSSHRGADDVIIAVGSGKAIEAAQHYAGRYGVINLFGGLKKGQDIVSLDTSVVHYKEVNVTGSSGGSAWDVAQTLKLMSEGEVEASAHITRIGDLAHATDFIKMVRQQQLDGKAVVYPHRQSDNILSVERWRAEDEAAYLAEG
jgi:threonine dehydrogenase-like Zn-dependent dehydrogenase